MLNSLSDWFHKLSQAGCGDEPIAGGDPRLSVAAILVHIVAVDGVVTDDEKRRLREVLSSHYGLDARETERLLEEARKRDEDAVDLYGFTSVLKRELSEDERREVVELMWEMVIADGKISEFEDNVVWRVAELIGVSTRDRVLIKQAVEAKTTP
ncbi:MAG: TerB family tellurite resistance protein [Pseudomonadota bacterium]